MVYPIFSFTILDDITYVDDVFIGHLFDQSFVRVRMAWCHSVQRLVCQLARKRALRKCEALSEVAADNWAAVAHALARAMARQVGRTRQLT